MKKEAMAALLLLLSVPAYMSCTNDRQSVADSEITVKQEALLEGTVAIADSEILMLDMPDDVVLNSIASVSVGDSMFVISDVSGKVYGFDRSGHYRCRYGSKGEGPEEYVTMGAATLTPQGEVALCDPYRQRMLMFDQLTGDFVREVKFADKALTMIHECAFVSDSVAAIDRYIYNKDNSVYATVNLDTHEAVVFDSVQMSTDNVAYPIGVHSLSVSGGQVGYVKPFDPVIYRMPGKSWITIQTDQKVLTPEELAGITDFSIMTYADVMDKDVFMGYNDIFVMDGYIYLGCFDMEYAVVDLKTQTMKRYGYQKDPLRNFIGIAKIISCDPSRNMLVGINSGIGSESDRLYLYRLDL